MNALGVKLYLTTVSLSDTERLFIETEVGPFVWDTTHKTWRNYRILGPETAPECFGTWKIDLEQADEIDSAIHSGRFLLIKRDEKKRNERVVVLNGYKLYGLSSFNRIAYLA